MHPLAKLIRLHSSALHAHPYHKCEWLQLVSSTKSVCHCTNVTQLLQSSVLPSVINLAFISRISLILHRPFDCAGHKAKRDYTLTLALLSSSALLL